MNSAATYQAVNLMGQVNYESSDEQDVRVNASIGDRIVRGRTTEDGWEYVDGERMIKVAEPDQFSLMA